MKSVALGLVLVIALGAPAVAQTGNSAWVSWVRANHHPVATVRSSEGDTFADFQFFKTVLANRRLVQLGESGHGVAEFNQAKVRLIKFLHQQMGFDVIAFESGLYECFAAGRKPASTAETLMRDCIFGVWHTEEVLALFDYIKSTQATSRPLTLAGFDSQNSSRAGAFTRPDFFGALVGAIDPQRATAVVNEDRAHLDGILSGAGRDYATANESKLTAFYGGLESFFREHRARLATQFGRELPLVAEQAAWSAQRYFAQLRLHLARPNDSSGEGGGALRDASMADNLTFLADTLYPGRKIMVWAHNFHIRHDNPATESVQPTMGQWIKERFRAQLYTIGLYMNRGTAAYNNRQVYAVFSAFENSMEWVLAGAGASALFVDFLHQQRVEGNAWMFQPTWQREWGTIPFTMVPREQYDGVLFVDRVRAPSYLQ
jgi:erythromycin esterase